jgi:hypothetical protein
VALHMAAIDGHVAGVFSIDGLASFESLATSERYTWSHEDFLPLVLLHYDLPELVKALAMPVLLINPLGPTKTRLTKDEALNLYTPDERVQVLPTADAGGVAQALREFAARWTK